MVMAFDRIDLGTGFLKRKNEGLQQFRSLNGVPMFNEGVASSSKYQNRYAWAMPPT